jgi:hypothetical protein
LSGFRKKVVGIAVIDTSPAEAAPSIELIPATEEHPAAS